MPGCTPFTRQSLAKVAERAGGLASLGSGSEARRHWSLRGDCRALRVHLRGLRVIGLREGAKHRAEALGPCQARHHLGLNLPTGRAFENHVGGRVATLIAAEVPCVQRAATASPTPGLPARLRFRIWARPGWWRRPSRAIEAVTGGRGVVATARPRWNSGAATEELGPWRRL